MSTLEGRLPDFLIGGAPRSGTTWLWKVLDRHPRLWMAKPFRPEPKFFLWDELYEKGLAWYADTFFPPESVGRMKGEKTTYYLESATCCERIARDLPRVKNIFLLREPGDRAFSNWLWSRQNGHEKESFERALELEPEREKTLAHELRYARPHDYFGRGLYAKHLRRYFDRFPRESILVLKFEDVVARPGELAARVHRFLGVAERPEDADLGVVNPSEKGDGEETMPAAIRRELDRRYAEPNRELRELLGPSFQLWR